MRVHLQVSHILTNMVGAASDVQARRAELMQSGLKPRDFVDRGPLPRADVKARFLGVSGLYVCSRGQLRPAAWRAAT